MLPQFYSFREACSALKVSPHTLRARLVAGEISGRKIGGQWRFTEADLTRVAERRDNIDALPTPIPLARAKSSLTRKCRKDTDGRAFLADLRAEGFL